MPTCLLPISTLAEFLKTMTYRCRGRATPRCHPDCKSKAVLDSICNSCHAIKECLKNEEEFDKFFDDEEFETSHWPCERCLEALKSIKMFWKIIIEKIFNITLPRNDEKVPQEHCFTDSVQSVAKAWQTEMLQQAMKEIERLKRENSSLKVELQNVYKSSSWKSSFHACSKCSSNHKTIALLPKPFECYAEENANTNQVKPIDSEMIITMKNCKNEAYRHISLLQVLHKTNDPGIKDLNSDGACGKRKEDPIELLTKVQNTFGAIVKREMDTIANNKRQSGMRSDIDATFHSLNSSRSAPSCSTITVDSTDSNHVRFLANI
ncbi:unnamed protein product [Spodoptera exigua]|nr:unnamed protein product [Spodoptera exigua]